MAWTNQRKGTDKPTGATNNSKVTCSRCGTPQLLKAGRGQWECNSCKKLNGGR